MIDSRAVEPGDLFFGLAGERADGGEFAAAASTRARGASLSRETRGGDGARAARGCSRQGRPARGARGGLARGGSSASPRGCRVVGVTGSTGKTSTKDILCARRLPRRRAHANRENCNTEIGLPLTVLERDERECS